MSQYYVYIVSNWTGIRIYIGVTSDLEKRLWQHKNKVFDGFSKKYNLDKLVCFEIYQDPENAIKREKEIKAWRGKKKKQFDYNEKPQMDRLVEWMVCRFLPSLQRRFGMTVRR